MRKRAREKDRGQDQKDLPLVNIEVTRNYGNAVWEKWGGAGVVWRRELQSLHLCGEVGQTSERAGNEERGRCPSSSPVVRGTTGG